MKSLSFLSLTLLCMTACSTGQNDVPDFDWDLSQDSTQLLFSISEGLLGPEAVRYDKSLDVYFIANFNGSISGDSNGFISKADSDGNMLDAQFMTGTETYPLHAPRGMLILGNELFAADADGVHVFDKHTGEQLRFIDFTSFEPGFLNDISADSEGNIYVTDTGNPRTYRIRNNTAERFLDSLAIYPNGVTLNPRSGDFVLAPWRGDTLLYAFNAGGQVEVFADFEGGYFDGLEFVGDDLIVASQLDSTLRRYHPDLGDHPIIYTPGRPADIGIDTKRYRVAVPYIAKNRVDVWELPVKN